MIPIKLTLQGFYSYIEEQTIDFEYLTRAQLFGIFGATGSGKSSILEAVTFALYGELERLNKQDSPGYNLMNLKSDRMKLDFEFWAGKNGQEKFKVLREYRRNSKRFDDIKVQDRRFLVWSADENNWIPELRSMEEVIGLSYDNFRKTIIIPQGKFQDFVQLKGAERTDMLKDIFKLDKFDLQEKAANVERKNNEQIAEKQTLLGKLTHVSTEQFAQIQEQLTALDQQAYTLNQQLTQSTERHNLMKQAEALFFDIEQKRTQLNTLEQEADYFKELAAQINTYTFCREHFQPLLDKKQESEQKFHKNTQSLRHKKEEMTEMQSALDSKNRLFADLEREYNNRHLSQEKIKELQVVGELVQKRQQANLIESRIAKGKITVGEVEKRLKQFAHGIAQNQHQIEELRATMPNQAVLAEVRNWFEEAKSLKEKADLLQKNEAETLQDLEGVDGQIGALLEKVGLARGEGFENLLAVVQSKLEADRKRADVLQKKAGLSQYADLLREGEPCPLCGATHHPQAAQLAHLDDSLTQAIGAVKADENALQLVQNQYKNWELLQEQAQKYQSRLAERSLAHQAALDALATHQKQFHWDDFKQKTYSDIQQIWQQSILQQKEILELEREKAELDKKQQNEQENRDKYQKALADLERELLELNTEIKTTQAHFRHIRLPDYEQLQPDVIQAEISKFEQQLKGIEDLYRRTQQEKEGLSQKLIVLQTETAQTEQQQTELRAASVQLQEQLLKLLPQSGFTQLAEVEQLLAQRMDTDTMRQQLQAYEVSFKTTQSQLLALLQQSEGIHFDVQAFNELEQQLATLRQQSDELNQHKGKLVEQQNVMERDLADKKRLEKELEQLEIRANDIKTIKKMLDRRGFVEFVAASFLQQLCEQANERFTRLTQGKLQLETAEDGRSLQVRDFFHEGKIRSIKTLSGGQTFQAALCLALALADSVQSQIQSEQKFFFIDEGFGSQDREALSLIFDTLQSLRKENRIVGIISHVEELQQEIHTHLHIQNKGERGSLVVESWKGG